MHSAVKKTHTDCSLGLTRFKEQLDEHFQIKSYFSNVRPVTVDQIIAKKKFFSRLERDKNKPFTLVLDLDETLIHTIDNPANSKTHDAIVESYEGGKTMLVHLSSSDEVQHPAISGGLLQDGAQEVRAHRVHRL